MRYSFRNTLCGVAVLAAAGLLADLVYAQGNVTLLPDDNEVNLDFEPANGNISLETSLPGNDGLISPSASETGSSSSSDVIPMDIDMHVPAQASVDFSDDGSDIDAKININPQTMSSESNTYDSGLNAGATTTTTTSTATAGGQNNSTIVAMLPDNINNELFLKMSDLERQTTLLNLELKKERIASEIAAIRAERARAIEEEEKRKEEEERKRIEWENEQERLMVEEQRKLREVEMALEELRQEKIIKAYKETMLASTQKWIKKNAEIYAEIAKRDEIIKDMLKDYKEKFGIVAQKADDTRNAAEVAKVNHDKKVANLENQIEILKTRLEAEIEKARQAALSNASGKNPFADGTSGAVAPEKVKLSREYAIMEILGSGDDLAARLINEDGDVFMVKVGTTLRNGYTIDEITKTFLSAVKENDRDYLYFSAGGILDREPMKPAVNIKEPTSSGHSGNSGDNSGSSRGRRLDVTKGIPSLGQGMIVK